MLDRIVLLSKRQITPQVKLQKKVSDVSSAVCVVVGLFVLLLRCYCVAIVLLLKQKLCATLQVKLQRNVVYGVMWLCLMVVMLSVWCWCIAIDVRCVCSTNDGPHGFFFSSFLCVEEGNDQSEGSPEFNRNPVQQSHNSAEVLRLWWTEEATVIPWCVISWFWRHFD